VPRAHVVEGACLGWAPEHLGGEALELCDLVGDRPDEHPPQPSALVAADEIGDLLDGPNQETLAQLDHGAVQGRCQHAFEHMVASRPPIAPPAAAPPAIPTNPPIAAALPRPLVGA
jgi:hypothetical protein